MWRRFCLWLADLVTGGELKRWERTAQEAIQVSRTDRVRYVQVKIFDPADLEFLAFFRDALEDPRFLCYLSQAEGRLVRSVVAGGADDVLKAQGQLRGLAMVLADFQGLADRHRQIVKARQERAA